MMLHDKILPGQFLLDVKNDCGNSRLHNTPPPSASDIYRGYNFHHHHPKEMQTQRLSPAALEGGALDLSRRCDSVETRKTPSPYNSTSSYGTASPSTHCGSPPNSTQATQPAPPNSSPAIPPPQPANKLHFSQAGLPLLPQSIASLYPLYYPNIKHEIVSPPPTSGAPVMPTPLPLFAQNPAILLQQTLKSNPAPLTLTSRRSEDRECSSASSLAETGASLYPSILNAATTGTIHSGKNTRPFNAYPRDPMLVAAHFAASDVLFDNTTMERYSTYRKRALDDLRDTNGGHRVVSNPKMRRTCNRSAPSSECEERAAESSDYDSSTGNGSSAERCNKNDTNNNNENETTSSSGSGVKDEAYYERRRKNNAAAKKSRDRRRIKEDEIAIRAAYLERQNIELLCQIDALKKQLEMFTKA